MKQRAVTEGNEIAQQDYLNTYYGKTNPKVS
jgi:hypothetical protein